MRLVIKLAVVVVCLVGQSVLAQIDTVNYFNPKFIRYNFNFDGGGARAAGMGHAYTAISDDMSALSWNPAGLLAIDKVAVTLSYRKQLPRGSSSAVSFTQASVIPGADISSDPDQLSHSGSFGDISNFSLVVPTRVKGRPFVGSISYNKSYDEYQVAQTKFSADLPVILNLAGFLIPFVSPTEFDFESELHGGLNMVSFGFGTRLHQNLSGGLAINVYTGHTYRTETFEQHSSNYPTLVNFSPQFVQSDAEIRSLDSNKFSGFNVSLGFKYAQPQWSAGLVIRTPFSLDVTLDSIQYLSVKFNGQSVSDAADTVIAPRELTRYRMPLIIRGGFGFRATPDLLLALDLEYQGFSGKKILYRTNLTINPGASNIEEFHETSGNWESVFAVRAGAEYLKKTGIGEIPLRAGFGFVPLPAPSISLTGTTSAENSVNFSLGTGIHWSQILFDVAYNYSSYDQNSNMTFPLLVSSAFTQSGYSSGFTNAPVTSKYHNHQFTVSFTGYF